MATLGLNFLGEIEVVRDGCALLLPPSRKTRALLAYLALNPRAFRRETLCELLWEVPDDPRGSLRWSLSKLRRLVDDTPGPRVLADRAAVRFDASDVAIDVVRLHALANTDSNAVTTDALESTVAAYRGNFLEGLELSSFPEFHAWCAGERERAAHDQATLLRALTARLADDPERALRYARSLVVLSPYDELARAELIRLLVRLKRTEEAEQHYHLGQRMLQEVGATASGALLAAWRGTPGRNARPTTPAPEPQSPVAAAALVGRDQELKRMHAALTRARGGAATVVLLRGEPGMGKTRLLQALATMAREAGAALLEANAYESESVRPFALWIDALRKWPQTAASEVFKASNRDNREHLFSALGELVAHTSSERLLTVLFDDLQWCDESSAAALHYVARTSRQCPLLVVLCARDGELRDNAAVLQAVRSLGREGLLEEIVLGPLPADAARALIESCAPGADSERLSQQCAGNPLLAIELARAEADGSLGASLMELVRERLERFDVEGAEVLRWASVMSPNIDLPALVRATGMDSDRVGVALERAERQAILLPAERGLRFSHDLVARSVYADISPARRRVMHRRVAELLEHDTAMDLERAADLAHHASQSGEPGLACRAMVNAGRLCLRFFANDDAQGLARRGLQLAKPLPTAERVCLSIDLHDILLAAAPLEDWQRSAATYVELAEQALDHGALPHARLGYHMAASVRWAHGHWAQAREESLQSERIIRGGSDREHVVGMAETAKCLAMLERDLSRADALLMEARALAAREGVSHHALYAALGLLRFHENELPEAEELLEQARTLCKSAGDRVNEYQACETLAMIAFERGDYAAAETRCESLLQLGERLRDGSEAPFARSMAALCQYALQDDDRAFDAALAELRAADAKFRLAYTLTRAALLDVARNRPALAMERAAEALDAATLLERPTEMVLAHVALVQAHRLRGETDKAAAHQAAIAELKNAPVARWAWARVNELVVPAEAS